MTLRRIKVWLALWIVLMACTVYVAGWVFYATMHLVNVGVQVPPGESVVTKDGVTIRLVSLHQSREVPGPYSTTEAAPGATFVLATLEATVSEPESFCHVDLMGRDGKNWEYTTRAHSERADFRCHEFAPGVPTRGEVVFEIPEVEVDHLMGVRLQFETDRLYRSLVLRPGEQP
ncbi:MAG TPA: DUF4352 domain-containing protein [Propionibacterium sp.]|nr:DUF4352 domain-containing protein [Propionibacterium sp.]